VISRYCFISKYGKCSARLYNVLEDPFAAEIRTVEETDQWLPVCPGYAILCVVAHDGLFGVVLWERFERTFDGFEALANFQCHISEPDQDPVGRLSRSLPSC
jgi:hypothetical protein